MSRVLLVHWNAEEAKAKARALKELGHTADLPASEQLAGGSAGASKEWQLIDVVDHHRVARIELRRSPEHARIVGVWNHVALVGAIVFAFR